MITPSLVTVCHVRKSPRRVFGVLIRSTWQRKLLFYPFHVGLELTITDLDGSNESARDFYFNRRTHHRLKRNSFQFFAIEACNNMPGPQSSLPQTVQTGILVFEVGYSQKHIHCLTVQKGYLWMTVAHNVTCAWCRVFKRSIKRRWQRNHASLWLEDQRDKSSCDIKYVIF